MNTTYDYRDGADLHLVERLTQRAIAGETRRGNATEDITDLDTLHAVAAQARELARLGKVRAAATLSGWIDADTEDVDTVGELAQDIAADLTRWLIAGKW